MIKRVVLLQFIMKKIGIIGVGTMGNGIAHTFAQKGFNVNLCGKNAAMLGKGVYVTPAIEKAV